MNGTAPGRWGWARRGARFGAALAVGLIGTSVFGAMAADDRDVIEVGLTLGAFAITFHLLMGWLAGPLRDRGPAEPLSRYAGLAVGTIAALVLGWPSGDWIPANDPRTTDAFVSPASNLVTAWLLLLAGYAVTVPLVLVVARVLSRGRVRDTRPAGRVGVAALDLLVIGLPQAVIHVVQGALPLPGDGVPVIMGVLLAGVWCGFWTLAGALWLASFHRVQR